jgi:hypothetical protein
MLQCRLLPRETRVLERVGEPVERITNVDDEPVELGGAQARELCGRPLPSRARGYVIGATSKSRCGLPAGLVLVR